MFGLMSIALLMIIGLSVDMARWLSARSTTIAAVDAAVLAGARHLQVNGRDADAATLAAQTYYEANVANRAPLNKDTITFKVVDAGTAITAEGTAILDTTFIKIAGIKTLPLLKLSGSEHSKAVLAVNGNAEFSIEVSLMLDVTETMCSGSASSCATGEKIDALKEAAKDLINVVVWDSQGAHTSRVAIVPFSEAVNIGTLDTSIVLPGPVSKKLRNAEGSNVRWYKAPACVAERFGPNAFNDAAPAFTDRLTPVYTKDGQCRPGSDNAVLPLTSDKSVLNNKIDGLKAYGLSGGHIGTAWAWYLLSPEWGNVLPAHGRPLSYALMSQRSSSGRPLLQKVAILMTDGGYNNQHCDTGQADRSSTAALASKGGCESANSRSEDQAQRLCAAMKSSGVTIYTVGFQLQSGGSPQETLALCATSRDHMFVADTASELKQSFRNIALKISAIHLTN
ncbi:MAG: VWA domain-containing protein [Alphaproteobacteria bacterium]|nr:VWA domain-containing protein [Alphaproteobacteria bacterium]